MTAPLAGWPLPDGLSIDDAPAPPRAEQAAVMSRAAALIRRLVVRIHARRAWDIEDTPCVIQHYRGHEAEAIGDAEALLADLERAAEAARGHA